jgi:hypothetical protein
MGYLALKVVYELLDAHRVMPQVPIEGKYGAGRRTRTCDQPNTKAVGSPR